MTAPRTVEEAQAQCLADKLGPSACAELLTPLCDGRGVVIEFGKPPRCVGGASSSRKAAVLLAEAQARQAPKVSPVLYVVGALGVVGLLYVLTR